jgi:hypothetical protein
VRFDFLNLFHRSIDKAGITYPYGEAIDLVMVLAETPGTHTHASENDWEWPATWAEIASIAQSQRFLNLHRGEGTPPVSLPMPWPESPKVTAEEMREAEKTLERRSAFAT